MTAPAALYRRYRPDTFKDVIGQEHVTEPLMTALRKDRISHAYLFSGPRGCGKTTSARILARCLNCEKGPTPEPCGVCPSCVELARGGAGSLDVIEIDAASHGGVDDARDLRERATFAPVRDRYKIFIIDEAHMVTSAGFNALLKIVEEPPEHIKFIFATTEPDKVIGTIRSRTHHYPFRLVPPEPLLAYLEQLCATEHVPVAPGVLSLVIRAGGGSVRDSLSVLDQLMAGAGTDGIDYELAVALLGYTHAALLDDVVDAMAAGDSGTVFRAVDRVIQTGHDPRRFVEDLLERFRDLIIVQALPDAAESILRGIPADQLARMRVQAQNLGAAELSRAADVTNEAFNEMTGATSPRLHLELLCARLMLPAADANERGWAARVDRLERRLSFAHDGAGAPPAAPAVERSEPEPKPQPSRARPAVERSEPEPKPQPSPAAPAVERSEAEPKPQPSPATPAVERSEAEPKPQPSPATPAVERSEAESKPRAQAPAPSSASGGGAGSVEMVRRAWPEILDALAKVKRSSWALVGPNASVAGYDGRTLALAFGTSGLAAAFTRGDHAENLRRAIHDVIGVDCQIDAVTGGNGPGTAPTAGGEQRPKAPADPPRGTAVPRPDRSGAAQTAPTGSGPQSAAPNRTEQASPPERQQPAVAPSTPEPSAADIAWGLAPAPAGGGMQTAPVAAPLSPAQNAAPAPRAAGAPAGVPAAPAPATTPAPARAAAADERASAVAPAGVPADVPPGAPDSRHGTRAAAPAPVASPAGAGNLTQPAATAPASAPAQTRQPAAPAPTPYDDIPYSDEEPPNDWDEPYPDDEASAPRRPTDAHRPGAQQRTAAAPAPRTHQAAPALQPPHREAGVHGGGEASAATARKPAATAQAEPSASSDPWSYAKETSPGVWTVGTQSNVQPGSAPAGGAPAQATPAESAPSGAPAPAATLDAAAGTSPSYAPAAAQPPQRPAAPSVAPGAAPAAPAVAQAGGGRKLSMYERLSRSAAAQQPAQAGPGPQPYVEDIPSADDEPIENSALFGRAAVERILGGKLVEERSLDGTPLPPR